MNPKTLKVFSILCAALFMCPLPSHAQIEADFSAGGGVKVGTSTSTCDGTSEGAIRYNNVSKEIQLCDGTSWEQIESTCDTDPDEIDFPDIVNATFDDEYTSIQQEVTGITCATDVSISGHSSAEYRVCNSGCGSWSTSASTVNNGDRMQVRLTAAGDSSLTRTVTATVGTVSTDYSVTTLNLGPYKRVFMMNSPRPGGNYGGRAAADTACQNAADAQSLGGTYYAWLSTDSTDDPESRFTRATIPYVEVSGGIVAYNWDDLVDGRIGEDIGKTASGGGSFSCRVWTNTRADGTAYSDTNNCSSWTSSSSGLSARRGNFLGTDFGWTNASNGTCNNAHCLLCFEQ